jgi:hypothetical protein
MAEPSVVHNTFFNDSEEVLGDHVRSPSEEEMKKMEKRLALRSFVHAGLIQSTAGYVPKMNKIA